MNTVFVDSNYFIAFISARDKWHEQALQFAQTNSARMLTSEYVLLETANYFAKQPFRFQFIELLTSLEEDDSTEIIPSSTDWWQQGVDLYIADARIKNGLSRIAFHFA